VIEGWYESRRYPWRRRPTPYRVLVSEIMLQQTQAARVGPAFGRFVRTFPSLRALAEAPRAEVVRAWAGLGHNRRAVALHEAAGAVVRDHGGRIPADPAVLQDLPGIGPYTAAAVAALGFGRPVPALDVNVTRVVARHRLGSDGASREDVRAAAQRWLDRADPAGWNQALMDLGRDVCRPVPRCGSCPLARGCRFRRAGTAPIRVPSRRGRFMGSSREARGRVVSLLRERSPQGLASLWSRAEMDRARVTEAVRALHRDGLIRAGPAALAGRPSGRIRLA
jgi:A/G-specific adenine glycosylase